MSWLQIDIAWLVYFQLEWEEQHEIHKEKDHLFGHFRELASLSLDQGKNIEQLLVDVLLGVSNFPKDLKMGDVVVEIDQIVLFYLLAYFITIFKG